MCIGEGTNEMQRIIIRQTINGNEIQSDKTVSLSLVKPWSQHERVHRTS